MNFNYFVVLCFLGFVVPTSSKANTAWWQFCDSCSTQSQFVQSARDAPGSHEVIYVTNRISNTTKKFDRFFTMEDLDGGYVYMTHIIDKDMSSSEQQVFQSAVSSSQVIFAPIEREALIGASPIGAADSAIIDLQNGFVSQGFISAVNLYLEFNNLLPDRESVNEELGLDIGSLGFIVGQGEELRTRALTVRIVYADDSYIQVTRQPNGELVNWTAQDATGNEIVLIGTNVNPGSFGNMAPYEFGPGDPELGQALLNLYQALNLTRWICSMEDLPNGGGVRLSCVRR